MLPAKSLLPTNLSSKIETLPPDEALKLAQSLESDFNKLKSIHVLLVIEYLAINKENQIFVEALKEIRDCSSEPGISDIASDALLGSIP